MQGKCQFTARFLMLDPTMGGGNGRPLAVKNP